VGPFRIVRLLGKGGMAAVYEAHDAQLDRTIALKVLPAEFLDDGTFWKRFEREAKLIAKLEHRNIVPIYASGIDEAIPWMSMPLLVGGNLGTFLEHHRPSPRDAVGMLRAIADALDYAHARGIVHRDIKPSNVLLNGSGGVCIGDFGLGQMLDADVRMTRTGMLIGTPHYMAPEQALGQPADHRCDVYSLGIVAYEMLVGAIPFTADSPVAVLLKHVNQPLPAPAEGLLSRPLLDAIQKAVAKVPADRWPSAGAFVGALETALGVTPADSAMDERGGKERHSVRSRLGWASAAAGALAAAAGLTWWIAREPVHRVPPPQPPVSERPSGAAPIAAPSPGTQERVDAAPGPDVMPERPRPRTRRAAPASQQQTAPLPTEATPPHVSSSVGAPSPQASSVQPPDAPVDTPAATDRTPIPAATDRTPIPAATDRTPGPSPSRAVVGDIVTPPVRMRTVSPDYPAAARAAQLEGDVLLEALIGTDGKVNDVAVLRSVHPLVDEAAKKAVRQYEYTPGRRNGAPEPVAIRVTVSFRLR
jgi:TonB family protein